MSPATRHRVSQLNDVFRTQGTSTVDWFLTAGVANKGSDFVALAIAAVRNYDGFNSNNDPCGERDFGTFSLAGERLLWNIDYYDPKLQFASCDPADQIVTRRVLTLRLSGEY